MDTHHANTKSVNQPDEDILENIWKTFQKEDAIRSIDLQNIAVSVEQGQVLLRGHVARVSNYQRMEGIARLAPGVRSVHNHLVIDRDLTLQVAESLGKDESLRPFILPVYCHHGWISLGGKVPGRQMQQAAEAAAARVPTVRGVLSLPRVTGECEEACRLAIQPPIGALVIGRNGTEGIVNQVIICPENRLVTNGVARVRTTKGMRLEVRDYLVPVEAMDVIDEVGINLKCDAPDLDAFPAFYSEDYPIAPHTWEPPYPYTLGKVRWPPEGPNKNGFPNLYSEWHPEETIGGIEHKLSR